MRQRLRAAAPAALVLLSLTLGAAEPAAGASADGRVSGSPNAETIARSAAGSQYDVDADTLVTAAEPLRYCVVCHGVELRGNPAVDAPNLSGLPAWYIDRQMRGFRQGLRGAHADDVNGMEMRPQAAVLSDDELSRAVSFAATVPQRAAPPTVDGDKSRGETLYRSCAACHGADGEGLEAMQSPPLAGQSDWYLVTQLQHFRAGVRGASASDAQGALMRTAAQTLTDDQAIRDVVAYINTLPAH